jgi:hypothetical protein
MTTFATKLAILFFATLLVSRAAAVERVGDSNGHLWLNYVGDHPLGEGPWGMHLEAQVRRAEMGGDWQQLLIRPGLNYQISPSWSVSAGWAFVETWQYGSYPVAAAFPEHRAWEQVQHTFKALGLEWLHRLRLEQRWLGEMDIDPGGDTDVANWRYENRIRYLLRAGIPVGRSGKTYVALWDEVFFNFGSNVSGNDFDQNRAFAGIGRKLGDGARIEIGYLEQTLRRRGGMIREDNHTLAVWFLSKWPFR